ncbi:MAG: radical SAM protein [Candidatus Altiarchaeota archaeon]
MFSDSCNARKALPKYFDIVEGREKARFLDAGNLEGRAEQADIIFKSCRFCERRCRVDRSIGRKGICGVLDARISNEFLHLGEEPELVPSHTIFFTGCTFKCVFCQNWDISQYPDGGASIRPENLARVIKSRGCRNVNWVGGDPTPNLNYILRVLTFLDKNIAQVWNSNMYLSEESMQLLEGVIDVYLTDFKYGCDECAMRLSSAPYYWRIMTRNHLLASQQCELLIRHLVLPGHFYCCTKPVLDWIAENVPDARVNVMDQYRPEYRACDYDEISEKLTGEEYSEAHAYAKDLGLSLV